MFAPGTYYIDESKLCFNKTHFSRTDFNVQRFMNLARQKADLQQIQNDLRLYLKSVQNSMIELINDDYADFVHLSSNLVELQETINKIDQDINAAWEEFTSFTKDAVGTAEKIEEKCEVLTVNRRRQLFLRNRIAFLTSLQELAGLVKYRSGGVTEQWLKKVTSLVSDLIALKTVDIMKNEKEEKAYRETIASLESVLCEEGVRIVSENCSKLPVVFSIVQLIQAGPALTAKIVSDYLYLKFVDGKDNTYEGLTAVFQNIMTTRNQWENELGSSFKGAIRLFLDQTLLIFLSTFIEKCMSRVAVPSDTRLFHKCFLATQNFIEQWPKNGKGCRHLLKAIREKFNLLVYFKLETQKHLKSIEAAVEPDNFALADTSYEGLRCEPSVKVLKAIEELWSENVYLPCLIDRIWDFTVKLLAKHQSWCESLKKAIVEEKVKIDEVTPAMCLLHVRLDSANLQTAVFNFALEEIWIKIKELNVDTAIFGNYLTNRGKEVDQLGELIDKEIVVFFADSVNKELAQVTDVPKQYRWTKKPSPTTHSAYLTAASTVLDELEKELDQQDELDAEKIFSEVTTASAEFFANKALEVLHSVEATGSSLSRFKRKENVEGTTDDDKIKAQIHHDTVFLNSFCEKKNISNLPETFKTLLQKIGFEKTETEA